MNKFLRIRSGEKSLNVQPGEEENLKDQAVTVTTTLAYTLGMTPANGNLNIGFTSVPPSDPHALGSLTINLRQDATIVLMLEPTWQWVFDTPAVQISRIDPNSSETADTRYFNLRTIAKNADGDPISVAFDAKYFSDWHEASSGSHTDPCNINVVFKGATTIRLTIDPGIQNPGDDTMPGGKGWKD